MPFTLSHAVVALPFIRTPLVPAAIAVGAMTPDLPLFVDLGPITYARTHSFPWLALTVLLALALLIVWRCVLRPAARELAPRWLAARLPGDWDGPSREALPATFARRGRDRASWLGAVLLLVGLAIGVVTHIVWDLFTHEGRAGVAALPGLNDQWGPLLGYKWLQYGSSAVGLVILAVWAALWFRRADAAALTSRVLPDVFRWTWWLALPAFLAIAWIAGYAVYGPFTAEFTVQHLAYRVFPTAVAVWGALTVALCIGVQVVRASRSRHAVAADG